MIKDIKDDIEFTLETCWIFPTIIWRILRKTFCKVKNGHSWMGGFEISCDEIERDLDDEYEQLQQLDHQESLKDVKREA